MARRIAYLLLAALFCNTVAAMPYFRHLSTRDGLVHPNVMAVCQDSLGRIWLGTENGVCYYDGKMVPVRETGEVTRLLCDNGGTVWFISDGSLFRYDNHSFESQAIIADSVQTIYLRDGNLHAVARRQDLRWNGEHGTMVPYATLPVGDIRSMLVDRHGNTWYACAEGLYVMSHTDGKNTVTRISSLTDINTLLESSGHEIWAGSRGGGLLRIRPDGTLRLYSSKTDSASGFRSNHVRCISEDKTGRIWFGTFRGLYTFTPNGQQFISYRREERDGGLTSESIHALCFDKDGVLWAGTYYGGVNYIDTREGAVNFYPEAPGSLSHPVVGHLAEGPADNIWICTEGGGVNLLRKGEELITHFSGQNATNVKWVEPCPEEDCLYIGSNQQGLLKLDIGKRKITKELAPDAPSALSIINVVVRHGDNLYLSSDDGVFLHSLASRTDSLLYPRVGNIRYVHEIIRGNELWLASEHVVVFDLTDHWKKAEYPIFDGEEAVRPMRLLSGSDGRIYASSFGHGLFRLEEGRFVPFPENSQFLNKSGYQLVQASGGQLLVSGEKGIQLLDSCGTLLRTYLPDHNLPLDALVMDSGLLLASDGTVYAGGTNGLVSFRLDSSDSHSSDGLYFTDFYVGGVRKDLPLAGEAIQLRGRQNRIELRFSSRRNLADFNWTDYQWRIDGHSPEWKDINGHILYAEHVPVGNYRFQIRRRNQPNILCSLEVAVLPQWYASPWAFTLYAILAGLIVWMLLHIVNLRREASRNQELNETKLRFFTSVSHELRSPLTLIIAQIDSIFRSFHLPPQVTHKMNRVMNQAQQMNQLVTELIDFRKFEQGLVSLHLCDTYVNAFVRDIFDKFKEIAAGKDLILEMIPASENPKADIDAYQMQKVLMNLIFNAVKYTPSGGRIVLSVESAHLWVHIHVRDTGIGIEESRQKHVFERFYQVMQSDNITQGIPGSGIGLALAKEIVERHHGQIGLTSKLGEGSDFVVSLPRSTAAAKEEQTDTWQQIRQKPTSSDNKPAVVIAEDNLEMLAMLKELFEIQYNVLCASDGAEALEIVREARPALVVSDVMMPRMDGTSLCAAIKGDKLLAHIPVVLLTAIDQTGQQLESLLKGADDYIAKPFDSRLLLTRCNNLVYSYRRSEFTAGGSKNNLSSKATSHEDKAFLNRISTIVEENIDNTELSNDVLAGMMNMSRSRFYQRFRSVTGETPNEYITAYRLQKAATLLRQEHGKSIAEISEQLGFNTQNYFCRRFKARFGVSPSQYRIM